MIGIVKVTFQKIAHKCFCVFLLFNKRIVFMTGSVNRMPDKTFVSISE